MDGSTFTPYNSYGIDDSTIWNSNSPSGAIISIDIPGPDNATVITSFSSTDKWTFTTINEPKYGEHPVSGNRDFGYNDNGDGSYTFYTRGVDRLTSWDGELLRLLGNVPFNSADNLWISFQNKVSQFVNTHSGVSTTPNPEKYRPNWDLIKDVLDGKKPISSISKNCPTDATN